MEQEQAQWFCHIETVGTTRRHAKDELAQVTGNRVKDKHIYRTLDGERTITLFIPVCMAPRDPGSNLEGTAVLFLLAKTKRHIRAATLQKLHRKGANGPGLLPACGQGHPLTIRANTCLFQLLYYKYHLRRRTITNTQPTLSAIYKFAATARNNGATTPMTWALSLASAALVLVLALSAVSVVVVAAGSSAVVVGAGFPPEVTGWLLAASTSSHILAAAGRTSPMGETQRVSDIDIQSNWGVEEGVLLSETSLPQAWSTQATPLS